MKGTSRVMDSYSDRDEHQTLTLSSGRILGYARYGVASSSFPTIIYLHGYPACRLEARLLAKDLFRNGFQVISIDRPGFGLSTPHPSRSMLDHAKDVEALAIHLKLSKFAILGYSGGAPYALACAHVLPEACIIALAIVAGLGPYEDVMSATVWKDLWWINKLGVLGPLRFPWLYGHGYRFVMPRILKGVMARSYDDIINASGFKRLLAKDQEVMRKIGEDGYRGTIDAFRESMTQESWASSHMTEARIYAKPWDFRLEDLSLSKVEMWYGSKDGSTPLSLGRHMASRIPCAKLHVIEDATHASMILEVMSIIRGLFSADVHDAEESAGTLG